MVGVSTTVVAVKGESQKTKKAAVASKAAKTKAVRPPTSEMVTAAIGEMNERGGSSLSAIKKYLAGNYEVDVDRLAPYIKKFLRGAVLNGVLIQTRGKGAAGSFKLPKTNEKPKPKPKNTEAKKKPAASKKVAKKAEEEEKPADSKKPTATPASPKKAEKKKVAAKAVKKSGAVAKTPKKKATKPVKATLNTSKVTKPKTAPVKKGLKKPQKNK